MPVEVTARDFHARLFLSCHAVWAGFGVIFGMQGRILSRVNDLPKGIYFDKSLSINKSVQINQLKAQGFRVVSIDEESLSSSAYPENSLNKRYSEPTLNAVDACFVWGKSEYELIKSKYSSYQNKFVLTGSPRIDILHKKNRAFFTENVRKINANFGSYFLFVSNFTVNHILGVNGKFALLKALGRIPSDASRKYYENRERKQVERFDRFVELVKNTARKFPRQTIVVRPHPSEDRRYWDQLAGEFDNVFVQREDSVIPWILGAEVHIHSGCTTGIEAFFLNVPSISFLPQSYSYETEKHVANDASYVCSTQEGVFEAIKKLNKSGKNAQKLCRNLDRVYDHIENCHEPDGTEKIVDKLKEISIPDASISFWAAMNLVARINKDIMMRNLRRLGSGKSKSDGFLERQRYDLQKTDDFSLGKVNEFVRVIRENHPKSNQHIRVKYLGKDIVYLTR